MRVAIAYAHSNSYRNGDCNGNSDAYADADTYAEAYSDAASASNAAAAPVAGLITLCGNSRSDSRVLARCQSRKALCFQRVGDKS